MTIDDVIKEFTGFIQHYVSLADENFKIGYNSTAGRLLGRSEAFGDAVTYLTSHRTELEPTGWLPWDDATVPKDVPILGLHKRGAWVYMRYRESKDEWKWKGIYHDYETYHMNSFTHYMLVPEVPHD